jgi:hypothetical protein
LPALDHDYWRLDDLGLAGPRFLQSMPPAVADAFYYAPLFDWQRTEPRLLGAHGVDVNVRSARSTPEAVLRRLTLPVGPDATVVTSGQGPTEAVAVIHRSFLGDPALSHLAFVSRTTESGFAPMANMIAAAGVALHHMARDGAVGYTMFFEEDAVRDHFTSQVPFGQLARAQYGASMNRDDSLRDPSGNALWVALKVATADFDVRLNPQLAVDACQLRKDGSPPPDVTLERTGDGADSGPRFGQLLQLESAGLGSLRIVDGVWRLLRFVWTVVTEIPSAVPTTS